MRSKTLGINVRVTPEEKEKLLKNADYCALSLSEYLILYRLSVFISSHTVCGFPAYSTSVQRK